MIKETTIEELKARLPEYVESITEKSKGENMFVCPLCGSGTGKNKTGAFSIKNETYWHCFSCDEHGDIFDLIAKHEGVSDFNGQVRLAAKLLNVTLDDVPPSDSEEKPTADYTNMFHKAQERLNDSEHKEGRAYLEKRGISKRTAEQHEVGYIPEWKHPKASQYAPPSPRVIVPLSKDSYFARDIREKVPEKSKPYEKQRVKGKETHFFNEKALYNSDRPVYITEGEISALSIIEVGGVAVALGSTSYADGFIKRVTEKPPTQPLIITMDNDTAGKKATNKLSNGLAALSIPFVAYNPMGDCNDPNDALVADRENFAEAIAHGNDFETLKDNSEIVEQRDNDDDCVLNYFQAFLNDIAASAKTPPISTGFAKFDEALGGGLRPWLYSIGGGTSIGKTAFVSQIWDNIARGGNDVYIFSLEMSRGELMSRSISRLTGQYLVANGGNLRDAKSELDISDGCKYSRYSDKEKELINHCMDKYYNEYCPHIYIHQGVGDVTVDAITERIERHIKDKGRKPVVFVDYLQLIAAPTGFEQVNEKLLIDKNILELKRLSRDFKIPIIAISSFSRANYNKEASLESFKQSGAIEYTCDMIIGLQLQGADGESTNSKAARKKNPRNIQASILKNRKGQPSVDIDFNYYTTCSLFEEKK